MKKERQRYEDLTQLRSFIDVSNYCRYISKKNYLIFNCFTQASHLELGQQKSKAI